MVSVLFTLCMLCGCGQDSNVAVKNDSMEVPKTLYQWYLIKAYDEAYLKTNSSDDVWKEEIEGQDATEWIQDRALYYCKRFIAIENQFTDLKLVMSTEDTTEIDDTLETFWNASGYNRYYEDYGVDESAFRQVLENQKKEDLMYEYYSEELLAKVSKEEIDSYYNDHCYLLEYLAIPFTKLEALNSSSEEASAEALDTDALYQEMKTRITGGESLETLIKEASANSKYTEAGVMVSTSDDSQYALFEDSSSGLGADFMNILGTCEVDKLGYYEDEANMYHIIYKKKDILSLEKEYNTYVNTVKEQVSLNEFASTIDGWCEDIKVEENKKITRKQDLTELF